MEDDAEAMSQEENLNQWQDQGKEGFHSNISVLGRLGQQMTRDHIVKSAIFQTESKAKYKQTKEDLTFNNRRIQVSTSLELSQAIEQLPLCTSVESKAQQTLADCNFKTIDFKSYPYTGITQNGLLYLPSAHVA